LTAVVLEQVLTCPACGGTTQETMPDECLPVFSIYCRHCAALLKPISRTLLRVLQLRVDQVRPGAAGRRLLPVI